MKNLWKPICLMTAALGLVNCDLEEGEKEAPSAEELEEFSQDFEDEDDEKMVVEAFAEQFGVGEPEADDYVITDDFLPPCLNHQISHHPITLTTYTGDVSSAGTDADVEIRVHHPQMGWTPWVEPDTPADNYQRGQADVFPPVWWVLPPTGSIDKVEVRHDNSGAHPSWYVDKVTVKDGCDGSVRTAHFDTWIATWGGYELHAVTSAK